ncbi:cytochrome P450 315a1, mitochondrial-like [Uloborus diversus]|uniref:cytochrome P450 315a1, mitochondrial-like n=1 Tax=Uloborus diversus TaxID=327109 RepID=UPI002409C527|nr:cytochrome P450 315a1, mitochondrial-like [Uloborus diversus]
MSSRLPRMLKSAVQRRANSSTTAATSACPFHKTREEPGLKGSPRPLKPFKSVPAPRGLPLVGTALSLIMSGGAAKIHEYCDRRHRELGPIFRERLGAVDAVIVSKKDYIQRIYLGEGKHPVHMVPEPWLIYNQQKGIKRGLFFMDGSQWLDRRRTLNQALMNQREVAKHGPAFNEIVTDLTHRWEKLSRRSPDGVIPNLERELYNWSIETLGTMVFGRRLGCVLQPSEGDHTMHKFVDYVQQIFVESSKLSIIPPKLAVSMNLPVWQRFVYAADNALSLARKYAETRISEVQKSRESGIIVPGVLNSLLAEKDVTHDEIVNIVADLILAAADTTSHATQWALHLLAKNPQSQEQFHQQIRSVVKPNETLTDEHLDKIPYAKWIIKETLRLYPIATFLTRVLPQRIVLEDYEIPAGKLFVMSQYTAGRDEETFPNPHSFVPERWERDSALKDGATNACLPFGLGARACIGRRVAELKMRLLLARVVQKFHLESANEKEVEIALRLITTPDQPIKLRLKKRTT